jgi:hypothetical protein
MREFSNTGRDLGKREGEQRAHRSCRGLWTANVAGRTLVVGLCYAAAACARSESSPAIASSVGAPWPTS